LSPSNLPIDLLLLIKKEKKRKTGFIKDLLLKEESEKRKFMDKIN